jgi:hypothetical protein
MANEDLTSLSRHRLKIEFERLDVEHKALDLAIVETGHECRRLQRVVKTNGAVTGASGIITLVGFVGAAINPFSVILGLGGFACVYFSGKGCFEDAALIGERRERLRVQDERLREVEARMLAIRAALRSQRAKGRY